MSESVSILPRSGAATGDFFNRRFLATTVVALVISAVIVMVVRHAVYPLDMVLGWGLATINAIAAFVLHGKAIEASNNSDFVMFGIVSNACRLLLLVGAIAICFMIFPDVIPFLITILVTFFLYKLNEVLSLHQFGNGDSVPNG